MSIAKVTKSATVLAVDIGGTKLEVGVVSAGGAVLSSARIPTPVTEDAEVVYGALTELISKVDSSAMSAVGVGSGGPMTKGGDLLSPLNIPAWRDFPLKLKLAELLGRPIYVDNDAKVLAVGERRFGAAEGLNNFVAMVVSTGVGSGIVLDGSLLNGGSGNAGHIGHMQVVPGGRLCACGGSGCLEAYVSGPSIERITGKPAAAASVEVRDQCARYLGRAIANVASLLDVSDFYLAGSVAIGFGPGFMQATELYANEAACISFLQRISVGPTQHGMRSSLMGAAAYALAELDLAENDL